MKWRIALGLFSALIAIAGLTVIAIKEPDRMESFTRSYYSRQIETGALLFENNCRSCHGPQGRGIDAVAPGINLPEMFNGERLEAVGWTGTVEDYLSGVIAAGRPVPSAGTNYPQRMPTWGEAFGGPMREDEIEGLVAFIMNWEEVALAEVPDGTPAAPPDAVVGTDITIELPAGDPERGKALSEGGLGCSGCHVLAEVGPGWGSSDSVAGMGERGESRLEQEEYSGNATSAEEYLIESVVLPNVFLVDGYQENVMPANYGERLTAQDLADLLAYMLSFR